MYRGIKAFHSGVHISILSLANVNMGSLAAPLEFQEPVVVRMSEEERVSSRMTEEHVAEAVIAFHRDGFVVLENVVDPEHCTVLDKEMCDAAERMKTDPKTIWNDVCVRIAGFRIY